MRLLRQIDAFLRNQERRAKILQQELPTQCPLDGSSRRYFGTRNSQPRSRNKERSLSILPWTGVGNRNSQVLLGVVCRVLYPLGYVSQDLLQEVRSAVQSGFNRILFIFRLVGYPVGSLHHTCPDHFKCRCDVSTHRSHEAFIRAASNRKITTC